LGLTNRGKHGISIEVITELSDWEILTPEIRSPLSLTYNMKIVVSFIQIATSILAFVDFTWPSYFSKAMQYFNFVNIDFIPWQSVQCATSLGFFDKLIVTGLIPVALALSVFLFVFLPLRVIDRYDYRDDGTSRHLHDIAVAKCFKLLLFGLFLLYPSTSAKVLSMFLCRTVDGHSYMLVDFSIECGGQEWNRFLPAGIIFLIAYPIGIPLVFFGLLRRYRNKRELESVRIILGFLFSAYNPRNWYFEMVDMGHKLFLTSLIPFFPTNAQIPVAMVAATLYLIMIITIAPYVREIDDRIHALAQIQIFLLLLLGLTISNNGTMVPGSAIDIALSFLLFLLLIILFLLFLYHGTLFLKKTLQTRLRNENKKAEAAEKSEDVELINHQNLSSKRPIRGSVDSAVEPTLSPNSPSSSQTSAVNSPTSHTSSQTFSRPLIPNSVKDAP